MNVYALSKVQFALSMTFENIIELKYVKLFQKKKKKKQIVILKIFPTKAIA